jgi:hypothetical protein
VAVSGRDDLEGDGSRDALVVEGDPNVAAVPFRDLIDDLPAFATFGLRVEAVDLVRGDGDQSLPYREDPVVTQTPGSAVRLPVLRHPRHRADLAKTEAGHRSGR